MKRKSLIVLLLFLLILAGCTQTTVLNESEITTENVIKYLTSNDTKGRLVGTDGNKKAEEFIVSYYEKIGLKPYLGNNYLNTYEQNIINPEKQKSNMTIKYNKDEYIQLVYGKDFLEERPINDFHIDAPITFDINDTDLETKILVLNSKSDYRKEFNKAKAIIAKTETFKKIIIQSDKKTPIIQVSKKVYDILESNKDTIVSMNFESVTERIWANNVIGKIPGKNKEEAVVISAHFDHIGWAGDEVYNGAIDNSTGIAVLLNVAKELNNYMQESNFNKDIIIAAFNGEESGRQGSISFANEIKKEYKDVYNINIDCIGIKDGGKLLIANYVSEQKNKTKAIEYMEQLKLFERSQLS